MKKNKQLDWSSVIVNIYNHFLRFLLGFLLRCGRVSALWHDDASKTIQKSVHVIYEAHSHKIFSGGLINPYSSF